MKHRKPVLLVTIPLSREDERSIRKAAPGHHIIFQPTDSYVATATALDESVEILFTHFAPATINHATGLKWVQLHSVGINHLSDSQLLADERVLLTNARGVMSGPIAEFTLGAIISLARDFPKAFALQQSRGWIHNADRMDHFPAMELRGRCVGIMGYGSVGREIARLAQAIGMKVSALSTGSNRRESSYVIPALRHKRPPQPETLYSGLRNLPRLLKESDFVVNVLPRTKATEKIFGLREFQRMKPTAYFINISRGGIVQEKALGTALKSRLIAGALFDMFEQEPLPPDSPVFSWPNLVIMPHIAGVYA